MPTLTRWYIKSSLVWFVAGLTLGIGSYLLPENIPSSAFRQPFFHMLVVGWVTQLIFGVVYWMFPKASLDQPRGNSTLAAVTFALLNIGLLARVIGEPAAILGSTALGGTLMLGSAVLQWLAGVGFVVNTWPRVTPAGHSTEKTVSAGVKER